MARRGVAAAAGAVALSLAALASVLAAPPTRAVDRTVSLARVRIPDDRLADAARVFDLTEHVHDGWHTAVVHPHDRARMTSMGIEVEVVVRDLVAHDRRERAAERAMRSSGSSERVLYRTLGEYEVDLDAIAASAPGVARTFDLPFASIEGRTVKAIEIADDVGAARTDGRPTAVYLGLHHAREWPSGEVTLMWAADLVASYLAGDEAVRELLRRTRVIAVPVVNPDGFVRSRHVAPDHVAVGALAYAGEFPYHRKNLRLNQGLYAYEPRQGVDLNRNYPFRWGGDGSSGVASSQVYRGRSPASEPEVRNLTALLTSVNVTALVTNHTFGNLVLWPWGHTDEPAPDADALRSLGEEMADLNGYHPMQGIGLYPTDGTTDDWLYAVTGSFGYTFEVGRNFPGPTGCGGFHPVYARCVPGYYEENRGAYLRLLDAAADPSLHAVLEGTAPAGTRITASKRVVVPLDDPASTRIEQRTTTEIVVGPSGSFVWHLPPSPLPETVASVRAGSPATELETYTVTATFPDGTTDSHRLLAERGGRYVLAL